MQKDKKKVKGRWRKKKDKAIVNEKEGRRRRTKKGESNDGERKKTWETKTSSEIGRETLSGDTIKPTISLQTLCNAN